MLQKRRLTAELAGVRVDYPVSLRISSGVFASGQDRELVQGLASARWEFDVLYGDYQYNDSWTKPNPSTHTSKLRNV